MNATTTFSVEFVWDHRSSDSLRQSMCGDLVNVWWPRQCVVTSLMCGTLELVSTKVHLIESQMYHLSLCSVSFSIQAINGVRLVQPVHSHRRRR